MQRNGLAKNGTRSFLLGTSARQRVTCNFVSTKTSSVYCLNVNQHFALLLQRISLFLSRSRHGSTRMKRATTSPRDKLANDVKLSKK